MVLLNAAKRARMVSSTINQNQGGGNKKAGLPYVIGRTASTQSHLGKKSGNCPLSNMVNNASNAPEQRPIGSVSHVPRLNFTP